MAWWGALVAMIDQVEDNLFLLGWILVENAELTCCWNSVCVLRIHETIDVCFVFWFSSNAFTWYMMVEYMLYVLGMDVEVGFGLIRNH